MRLLLVALAMLALACIVACDDGKNSDRHQFRKNQKWMEYKQKHLSKGRKKSFKTDAAEKKAFQIFEKNDEMIEKHNRQFQMGQSTFQMDHNEMTSMDDNELKSRTGVIVPADDPIDAVSHKRSVASIIQPYTPIQLSSLPATVDWRDVWTTDVRSQGGCGSCWAFSTVGAIESQILSAHGIDKADVSEQYLVDCSYLDSGCQGGWPPSTAQFVAQNGFVMENHNLYIEDDKPACPFSPFARLSDEVDPKLNSTVRAPYNLNAVYSLAKSTDTTDQIIAKMKDAIARKAPVMVCVYVNAAFHAYRSGVFRYENESEMSKTCNHAVLAVGYGNDPQFGPYWILRNSWGGWGEMGHMRLHMETKYQFLTKAAIAWMNTPTGRSRVMPPLNIAEGQHRVQKLMAERAEARKAEIASGCYDTDLGLSWPCSDYANTQYCNGGYYFTNEFGQQTHIDKECAYTCKKCTRSSSITTTRAASTTTRAATTTTRAASTTTRAASTTTRAATTQSGCVDTAMGNSWPCSSYAAYCGYRMEMRQYTDSINYVSTYYDINTECKRTCNKC